MDGFAASNPFGGPPMMAPPPVMGNPMGGGMDAGSGPPPMLMMFMMGLMMAMAFASGGQGDMPFAAENGGGFGPQFPDGAPQGGSFGSQFPDGAPQGGDFGSQFPEAAAQGGGSMGDLFSALLPMLFRSFGSADSASGDSSFASRRMPDGGVAFLGSRRRRAAGPDGEVDVRESVRGRAWPKQGATDSKRQAIIDTANRLGIDPVDLAAVISKETGGTFDPRIRGGEGKRYRGLIQFGPSQRVTYGYSPHHTFEEQVRGPVYRYLKDRGVRPGMGAKNIYAAILTGRATGNIHARDSFGTSVSNALPGITRGGHRQNALRFLSKA